MFSCHNLVLFLFLPCNKILWIIVLCVSYSYSCFLVSQSRFEMLDLLLFSSWFKKSRNLGCFHARDIDCIKWWCNHVHLEKWIAILLMVVHVAIKNWNPTYLVGKSWGAISPCFLLGSSSPWHCGIINWNRVDF